MITAQHPIDTLESLRDHLQYAIGLELTTVPAYLCGLYSISPGANSAACETIQSVVLEEMLHMTLAANLLNAIGGAPSTGAVAGGPSPVPVYPARVSYIQGMPEIHLQAFSPSALDEFIAIESPGGQHSSNSGKQYGSIGDFYKAIKDGLRRLCPPQVFAAARQERGHCQLSSHHYYGGAGTLIEVTDLDSALKALTEIVREGEGLPGPRWIRPPASTCSAEHGPRAAWLASAPTTSSTPTSCPLAGRCTRTTPASRRSRPGGTIVPTSWSARNPPVTSCLPTGAQCG